MAKKVAVVSEEQAVVLRRCARQVWDEVGGEVLEATGRAVSRAVVLETVMDANRLQDRVRRDREATPELVRLAGDYSPEVTAAVERALRPAFPHARYGR